MIGNRRKSFVVIACLAALIALLAVSVPAGAKKKSSKKAAVPVVCPPVTPGLSAFHAGDAWPSPKPYKFPFYGYTPKGFNTVIWKKIAGSKYRKTDYPAPNLPACRIGRKGTEDRTSTKAGRYFESLNSIDGAYSYVIKDTFDRPITTIHWEEDSIIPRHPERWGWYVGEKWAGHDASRAFEVQGNACKLRSEAAVVTNAVGQPVPVQRWVRDQGYTMIAFNPALGSPNRKWRPNQTGALRVRGFIDRRALPGWLNAIANKYDFGCGASALPPLTPTQLLGAPSFKSGYGPGRQYIVGQYFGESATPMDLLPGETKVHNNMPYDSYNPKPQFNNSEYAMINTTGVSGGGMVRGIVRGAVDQFTLVDEMTYCDPNYTLAGMTLKRNHQKVSKWKYFELATFSKQNKATVRWVFGRIDPNPATVTPEQAAASQYPGSAALYAWIPIHCDR